MISKHLTWGISLLVAVSTSVLAEPNTVQVVEVTVQGGNDKIRYLGIVGSTPPKAAVMLLAGGNGVLGIQPNGSMTGQLSLNFLVRSRVRFANEGLYVAVVDAPLLIQATGMDGNYRLSLQHKNDLRNVVQDVADRAGAPVWLIGTSSGAMSVVNAAVPPSPNVGLSPYGVVFVSPQSKVSVPLGCGKTVFDGQLGAINKPALFVVHGKDQCGCSPPDEAKKMLPVLERSLHLGFELFVGGDPPVSTACEARSEHGFFGIEGPVVKAIADWVKSH